MYKKGWTYTLEDAMSKVAGQATREVQLHKWKGRWYYENITKPYESLPVDQYAPHKVACQDVPQ